jgi:hypothetical protein
MTKNFVKDKKEMKEQLMMKKKTISLKEMNYELKSSNRIHGKEYSIQHYVINFVSDLRQVGGFFRIL